MTRVLLFALLAAPVSAQDQHDYARDVAPILTKYCAGCHNADDREGGLSLETWSDLQKGGENGRVVVAGGPESSQLLRLITGEAEPKMPPDDNEAPTAAEIRVLRDWIEAGASGPNGRMPEKSLKTPQIKGPANLRKAVTAMDWSPDGTSVARSAFGEVVVSSAATGTPNWRISGLVGKVNSVRFSRDGKWLAVATGVTGLSGTALVYDARRGVVVARHDGHKDTLYAAVLSPDRRLLATAGYDRTIILRDMESGRVVRTLAGHNGAIFDLDFSPDGTVIASASADETVKVWSVATGERLDTRSEPLDEQYAVRFSPDGSYLLGSGADNRVRIWKFVSREKPAINPLLHARFAHEGPVTHLRFSSDGTHLASAAEDRTIKLWETGTFTPVHVFETQPSIVSALAMAPGGDELRVGRMDGSVDAYEVKLPRPPFVAAADSAVKMPRKRTSVAAFSEIREAEPNTEPEEAQAITVPATITGTIDEESGEDRDLYRFAARAGEEWVIEVKAARDKSPLDSRIAILNPDGSPVPRVLLRAVRDSYFTFRGKDSNTMDDFRVHNWREMELNEYLYANGEVVKLWLYPRGPDSGFKVYPGRGKRYGFFDTTPLAHPLHEPCYIVQPFPLGTEFVPNGLPTFTLNYENDDDARRKLGKDSRLFFTVPKDGQYLVRIEDTRGFSGPDFKYQLAVRPRTPQFKVRLNGANPTVPAGSGREFNLVAERIDGFDGPIRIDISGMPPGYSVTTPIIIQAGQEIAFGTINAAADAPELTKDAATASVVTATAFVNREKVEQNINNFGTIKASGKPKLLVTLQPLSGQPEPEKDRPLELTIHPGETISARVVVERNGFKGRIDFGKDDSGRNLPHGVFVDNIGLNGLMIVEGQSQREFFITAAKWVPETTRLFHLRATAEGGQTSRPVLLHVRRRPARVTRNR